MDLRFKFEIVDMDEGEEVLWADRTYILVDPTTGELSSDSIETHVYSALRGLKRELAQKAQQAEEAARQAIEDEADINDFENRQGIYRESATEFRARIAKIIRS